MKKLKIEKLKVESFDTDSTTEAVRGTVRGNDGSEAHTNCCHPYDISVDWTNCWTECCYGSNAWTCANYGCTP